MLPYFNIVNSLAHGDPLGAAMSALALNPATAPIAVAYQVFNLIESLFDDDSPPEAWGSAQAAWSGFNAVTQAVGENGGLETARDTMNQFLANLQSLAAREQALNPGSAIGVVANRLPSIGYRNFSGYSLTDIDPVTGVQQHPEIRYDLTGRPYNAPPGSEQASQSLGERFIRVALARGAVAPLWEAQTAAIQTQSGDPQAGLTEEERAGRNGQLAPSPQPSPAGGEGGQTWRPVALDLDGDGIQTTGANKTVAFDVDDSGFLKNTAWINNNDGLLFLDRNLNGQIDSGRELFSNGIVSLSARGLAGMRWVDANDDGSITAADPVWNELKVWQDANGDGQVEAGEERGLSAYGITSLNYALGTFEQNGQLKQLASPDLEADTAGTRTHVVPEGIIVESSNGQVSLLVTRIDDKTAIQANRDGVTSFEDVETIVSGADLTANDTLGGFPGSTLTVTGVANFSHGTGYLDQNGFVHFIPEANYFGEASFDYTIQAPTGQSATATVDVTLANVNDPPTATVDQHRRPIYGYDGVTVDESGRFIDYVGPHYAPYSGYDASRSDFVSAFDEHSTPIASGDLDGPNVGAVVPSDIDDPSGPFSFEVIAQPQKGEATIDASGNYRYLNWIGPNQPGVSGTLFPVDAFDESGGVADTGAVIFDASGNPVPITQSGIPGFSGIAISGAPGDVFAFDGWGNILIDESGGPLGEHTEPDPFSVRVTDPHGASTTVTVNAVHQGGYFPTLGSSGGGKKPIAIDLNHDGFRFTGVDDSNVFFDVNGDGGRAANEAMYFCERVAA